jgi:hypothetical protein
MWEEYSDRKLFLGVALSPQNSASPLVGDQRHDVALAFDRPQLEGQRSAQRVGGRDHARAGKLGGLRPGIAVKRTRSGMNRNSPPVVRKHDNALAALSTPTALIDWWIYFGTIQRERIVEIMRTDVPFCNDAERRIWLGIEEGLEPNETTAIMRADEKRQEPQAR